MAKMIFVNLPVSDLARSTAFYQAIGAEKNPQFSDDTASCMVISDTIYVMLLTHDKFRQFTPRKIVDAKTSTEVLICISADSRDAVDDRLRQLFTPRRWGRNNVTKVHRFGQLLTHETFDQHRMRRGLARGGGGGLQRKHQ